MRLVIRIYQLIWLIYEIKTMIKDITSLWKTTKLGKLSIQEEGEEEVQQKDKLKNMFRIK